MHLIHSVKLLRARMCHSIFFELLERSRHPYPGSLAVINGARIVLMNSGVNRLIKAVMAVLVFCLPSTVTRAQAPASSLTSRSITAIGYQGAGSTTIDLKGTGLIAEADGKARVEAKKGLTTIQAEIEGLASPTRLGTEFLTYVLWAVIDRRPRD